MGRNAGHRFHSLHTVPVQKLVGEAEVKISELSDGLSYFSLGAYANKVQAIEGLIKVYSSLAPVLSDLQKEVEK